MNNALLKELIELRREFHQCAETGWLEFETTIKIISYLLDLGLEIRYGKAIHKNRLGLPKDEEMKIHKEKISYINPPFDTEEILKGYTGVVGILDTHKSGPTIALRFDIDANGVDEKKEGHRPFMEGFASKNHKMMHACGHDGHIAIGLMVAKYLVEHKENIKGKILLIFQPAEEGVRGAKSMVEAGVLDGVDYILSGHIGFMAKRNEIICGVGGFLATEKMDIHFYGKPSHAGAYPELGKNALLAGASCAIHLHTITQFSSGMSRMNVGVFHAGTGRNVIPDQARLEIETRGENKKINDELIKRTYEIVEGSAKLYDVDYKIEHVGSAKAYEYKKDDFSESISSLLKKKGFQIQENGFLGGSEDITYMFENVENRGGKALYMVFGTELKAPHHNSCFDFDEDVLYDAYECYRYIIEKLMNES
ncbi:amidohydrolase [Inediibacterium massiliense]|uniref:amidohydrolase n=1 Tax=Inediibacterium massiliense TaxID=1658111 RepID=UPI0006B46CA5|nr:amidohydrolase [Inediibacterium massiliense]